MSKKKKTQTEDSDVSNVIELAEVQGLNLEFAEDETDAAEAAGESDLAELAASDDEVEAMADADLDAPHVLTLVENEGISIDEALADGDVALAEDTQAADADEVAALADEDGESDEAPVVAEATSAEDDDELSGTELESFDSAEIEELEFLVPQEVRSVVESALFATDKPLTIAGIKAVFKGTQVKSRDVRDALTTLQTEYAESHRGFTLEEIAGGFQLRTKADNMKYLRQNVKARPFKLSGPALEVLSIVAYKQPATKAQIDEIRGVESGHLLRALMEKQLLTFGERSDLPGKPMFYATTKKFLEIFSLRNLAELPSLSEIDQLIPEGIGEVEDKETLSDLTGQLSTAIGSTYSEAEDELLKITDELTQISTSSEFFEDEKRRERERRDAERARDLREAIAVGEDVEDKDRKWLERYEQSLIEAEAAKDEVAFVAGEGDAAPTEPVIAADAVETEEPVPVPEEIPIPTDDLTGHEL